MNNQTNRKDFKIDFVYVIILDVIMKILKVILDSCIVFKQKLSLSNFVF